MGRTLVIPKYHPNKHHNNRTKTGREFPFETFFDLTRVKQSIPTIDFDVFNATYGFSSKANIDHSNLNVTFVSHINPDFCTPYQQNTKCLAFHEWSQTKRIEVYPVESLFDIATQVKEEKRLYFRKLIHYSAIQFLTKEERQCFKEIVLSVPLNKSIVEHANKVVQFLGGENSFACIHLRRGDKSTFVKHFQYTIEILSQWIHISKVFLPNETIYIATDDNNFIKPLKNESFGRMLYSSSDFEDLVTLSLPNDYLGAIEQQICSLSRLFIHGGESTFSKRILEMRKLNNSTGLSTTYVEQFEKELGVSLRRKLT